MYRAFSRRVLTALTASAVLVAGLAMPAYAADEPSLVAGATQEFSAAVGEGFAATLSVTNAGDTAVDGVAIHFARANGFEATEQFANCVYDSGRTLGCTFDQTLEPGKSYRVVMPLRSGADAYAPGFMLGQFKWQTLAEYQQPAGTAGGGAELRLQEGDKLGENSPADPWQYLEVTITGDNGADLVAVGDAVSGTVGQVVEAEVGVHNNGPATLDGSLSGLSPGYVAVVVPAGTSVVSAPGCTNWPVGSKRYQCETAIRFKVGATKTWTFSLRIDSVVADGAGSVEVNPDCRCERFLNDLDRSNNNSPLSVAASVDTTAPVIVSTGIAADRPARALIEFFPTVTDNVRATRLDATVVTPGESNTWATCRPDPKSSLWYCKANTTSRPWNEFDAEITLRAFDAAGNASDPVTTTVHVDNLPPRFGFASATRTPIRPGPVAIELTGVPGDVVTVKVSEGTGGAVLATLTEAPWSWTWNATVGATPPCFQAADRAGNLWSGCTEYVVDDAKPIIAEVRSASDYSSSRLDNGGGWVGANSRVEATVTDQSPIVRTEWWVNGSLAATSPQLQWDTRAIAAPTANLELRVWDALGNVGSKSFPVNIDKAAPAATVSPAEKSLVRGTTFVTSIKAADRNGVAFTGIAGADHLAGQRTSVRLKSGKDGARTVTWQVIDQLGNSAYVKRTVTVDNTAPAVSFKSAPKNKAKLGKTVSLTAKSSDRNGIAKVQLLVNGKVVATDTRAAYAFKLNPKKYGKKFTVQLRAYDKAGNVKYSTKRTYRR
ncbi:Ig-like domain-containing protein [Actinoplanes sp. NPDC005259]|uniref:Ig-like domain-containing protein n=1 Tax=Actinoplanes sp. NPDC005259 TaxID=3154674 RepID=UPI0033AE8740